MTLGGKIRRGDHGLHAGTIYFRLEQVELGTDEDGDQITSCVVVESDAPAEDTAKANKLGKNEQTMLNILAEHMPTGLMQEEWNELSRKEGIGKRRRADLHDCRARLKGKGLAHESADRWFVTNR